MNMKKLGALAESCGYQIRENCIYGLRSEVRYGVMIEPVFAGTYSLTMTVKTDEKYKSYSRRSLMGKGQEPPAETADEPMADQLLSALRKELGGKTPGSVSLREDTLTATQTVIGLNKKSLTRGMEQFFRILDAFAAVGGKSRSRCAFCNGTDPDCTILSDGTYLPADRECVARSAALPDYERESKLRPLLKGIGCGLAGAIVGIVLLCCAETALNTIWTPAYGLLILFVFAGWTLGGGTRGWKGLVGIFAVNLVGVTLMILASTVVAYLVTGHDPLTYFPLLGSSFAGAFEYYSSGQSETVLASIFYTDKNPIEAIEVVSKIVLSGICAVIPSALTWSTILFRKKEITTKEPLETL